MNFGQSFRLALKSLMTSKMRALLTMLGIIIGVGAVIVITSLASTWAKADISPTSTLPATRTYASSALIWRKRPSRATPWASSCPSAGSTLPLSVCWRRTAT